MLKALNFFEKKRVQHNFLETYFIENLQIVPFETARGKHKLILSTNKMCIDEKKLRLILSDYSVIREVNQA